MESTSPGRGATKEEVAAYVASLAQELQSLVKSHDMSDLAYLLDLVRMEAEERVQDAASSREQGKQGPAGQQ